MKSSFCRFVIVGLALGAMSAAIAAPGTRPPNILLILCDNLGYGDIGPFGSVLHRTPNLDRMAREGMKLTHFYSASSVCTPSRAALMTGCYAMRVNLHNNLRGWGVLQPVDAIGLNPGEQTVAELLQERGYATAAIGKWHLGDQLPYLPTRQGFDFFFGTPYSDDMIPRPGEPWPPFPLLRNEQVIEAPVDRNQLTRRETEEAVRFIAENRDRPFFLYLPHNMPGSTRSPFSSEVFRGKSKNGPWGDAVEELDWSVGEVLRTLHQLGLDDNTLVVWTSDNGAPGAPGRVPPQGSNHPLGGRGYTSAEAGFRVPCLVRWPGRVPAGAVSEELVTMMDLLPTFGFLAGASFRKDIVIDGKNIWPILSGQPGAKSPHPAFYYYEVDQLQAVRTGPWKLYVPLKQRRRGATSIVEVDLPARLYNVKDDPGETRDLLHQHPDIVASITPIAQKAREELGDLKQSGKGQRPAGWIANPQPLLLAK